MTHISTPRLHQLRLGELAPAERAPLEAHLASCALCAGRLGHQHEARAAFVVTPVPPAIAALDRPSPWARLRDGLFQIRAALVLVPVAAALLVALRVPDAPTEPTERTKGPSDVAGAVTGASESERAKGAAPLLEAWIQTGESARPVYTGEAVRAGTRVQLKYDPGRRRFVTLAGRDARGTVEVYGTLPARGPGVAPAPFALTLDDAKGSQEFFAILTDTRPAPDAVLEALSGEPVRMDEGEIASVVLRKE